MGLWNNVLNLVLIGVAAACAVWALRQQAILQRIHVGLQALRQGKRSVRLRQQAEDTEPVLQAFDTLAEILDHEGAISSTTQGNGNAQPSHWRSLLGQIGEVLRPSFALMKDCLPPIAQHVTSDDAKPYVNKLRAQLDGLLRLLDTPQTLSELQRGVAGLHSNGHSRPLAPRTVLVVDDDIESAARLVNPLLPKGINLLLSASGNGVEGLSLFGDCVLILINVTRAEGVENLMFTTGLSLSERCRIWLYATTPKGSVGLWTPREFVVWPEPLPANWKPEFLTDTDLAVDAAGDEQLREQVTVALRQRGIEVESENPVGFPPIKGICCVATTDSEYCLIIQPSILAENGPDIADQFQRSVQNLGQTADMAAERIGEYTSQEEIVVTPERAI